MPTTTPNYYDRASALKSFERQVEVLERDIQQWHYDNPLDAPQDEFVANSLNQLTSARLLFHDATLHESYLAID